MQSPSGITVIIPTCNRSSLLMGVLRSLAKQTWPRFELIVVDQSDELSPDLPNTIETFPRPARLIRDSEKGAARARNIGLINSSMEIALFLEDDLQIEQTDLIEVHLSAYQDPGIGGVSGRVIESVNKSARGPVGKVFPLVCIPGGNGDGERRQYIETVKGGNMSFRRDVLKRIGGFDERFGHPSMYEETDVSLKIGRLGYKLLFVPEACVVHLSAPTGGQRTNYDPARFRFIAYRDRVLLFRNNYPAWLYPIFLVANFGLAVLPVVRGNWRSVQLALAGLREGMRRFGHVKNV